MSKVTKKSLKTKLLREKKKKDLYDNFRTSQRGLTRKQISRHWKKYRGKKYVITELPKYRKKLARAKDEIQATVLREKYFERKEIKTDLLQYGVLKIEKKVKHKYSKQDYFKIKKGADIDSTMKKVFADKKKNVRYILLTLKIRLAETGQVMYVSNTYSPSSFETVMELEETALENTLEKLSFVAKYKGFELISVHLRLVYAIPEKSAK